VSSRVIDEQILTISASGWTFFETFILYDYETVSMWYPVVCGEGFTCISGAFEDYTLPFYVAELTTWAEWVSANPLSKYLKYP